LVRKVKIKQKKTEFPKFPTEYTVHGIYRISGCLSDQQKALNIIENARGSPLVNLYLVNLINIVNIANFRNTTSSMNSPRRTRQIASKRC
jgi:hypothetical protein